MLASSESGDEGSAAEKVIRVNALPRTEGVEVAELDPQVILPARRCPGHQQNGTGDPHARSLSTSPGCGLCHGRAYSTLSGLAQHPGKSTRNRWSWST